MTLYTSGKMPVISPVITCSTKEKADELMVDVEEEKKRAEVEEEKDEREKAEKVKVEDKCNWTNASRQFLDTKNENELKRIKFLTTHHRHSEVVQLGDSAVGKDRMGSTLQHLTPNFALAAGVILQQAKNSDIIEGYMQRNRAWKALHNARLVDIGQGYGNFCNNANVPHGIICVGLEVEKRIAGAAIQNCRILAEKNDGKITFIPVVGDARNLKEMGAFGGADIVFLWCEGAPGLEKTIMKKFLNDNNALYILTNGVGYEESWKEEIRLISFHHHKMTGKNTGGRTIYLYGKQEYKGKRSNKSVDIKGPSYNNPSSSIRWAFQVTADLRATSHRSIDEHNAKMDRMWILLKNDASENLQQRKRHSGYNDLTEKEIWDIQEQESAGYCYKIGSLKK